jgi:hypothetical protein
MILVCWKILGQLAPWLLLGMLFSGLLSVLLPPGFIKRRFQGFLGVVKAVLFGVPLPLCSCGVVPAGIGLKNQGASSGASVGFLISTPQTGIDSILVSASFFGWPFAIFKMVTSAITGVVGGWLTDQFESDSDRLEAISSTGPNAASQSYQLTTDNDATALVRMWEQSVEILRSIWGWLLIGVLISAVIELYIPNSWFQTVGNWGLFPSMLLVLFVSTPLYVCATASVPIAAALVTGGLPPAAALVFLMAGPATNVTTIGAIYGRFGWKTAGVYLSTIVLGSMFFAWMFDWLLTADVTAHSGHAHDHQNWWSVASALILLAMIASFAWRDMLRWWRKHAVKSSDAAKIEISIQGMTCGGCVDRLESAIKKSEGVESVSVELKSGIATILGQPHLDEVKRLIKSLGFNVTSDGDTR